MSAGAPTNGERRAVVLLSGGLDSATTLALAIREGYTAFALTARYGQRHATEVDCAVEQARLLGAHRHLVLDVDLAAIGGSVLTDPARVVTSSTLAGSSRTQIPETYVPARNTILLSLGLGWAEVLGARDLFIGVNAIDYSGYPDCRPEFLTAFERVAALATRAGVEGAEFRIRAPLLSWNKARIVTEATALGVDLGRTVSCYDPGSGGAPCARCDACRLREQGFREAGLDDPSRR